jgi:hypothetical protein
MPGRDRSLRVAMPSLIIPTKAMPETYTTRSEVEAGPVFQLLANTSAGFPTLRRHHFNITVALVYFSSRPILALTLSVHTFFRVEHPANICAWR